MDFYYLWLIFLVNMHVPLKDKKVIAMVNLFEKVLDKSDCKSNKIWFDQGSEFYNKFLKNGYKIMKCK